LSSEEIVLRSGRVFASHEAETLSERQLPRKFLDGMGGVVELKERSFVCLLLLHFFMYKLFTSLEAIENRKKKIFKKKIFF